MATGLIPSYGLFWRLDELTWTETTTTRRQIRGGKEAKRKRRVLRLLGTHGSGKAKRTADFRTQSGLYILYNRYGAYYVGLVKADRLGHRLRDHLDDRHRNKWDRFSWFGFRRIRTNKDAGGLTPLGPSVRKKGSLPVSSSAAIGDIEALLIAAFGLDANLKQSAFRGKQKWKQLPRDKAIEFVATWKEKRQAQSRHRRQ